MTSAVSLLVVTGLVVWCWRATGKRDWARYSAVLAAIFLANEALLGAALVLLKHVAYDNSAGRILFLCLHLGNTLLLLGSLSLTAVWLSNGDRRFRFRRNWREAGLVGAGLLATMLTGITGAVAALADTLFPSPSLRLSLTEDFGSATPRLLHYRLIHPAAALIAAAYLLWIVFRSSAGGNRLSRSATALVVSVLAQVGVGIANVLLLAPVWLQIVHLFVADVLWALLVVVSADLILERAGMDESHAPASLVEECRES